jgi:hypothetical protein
MLRFDSEKNREALQFIDANINKLNNLDFGMTIYVIFKNGSHDNYDVAGEGNGIYLVNSDSEKPLSGMSAKKYPNQDPLYKSKSAKLNIDQLKKLLEDRWITGIHIYETSDSTGGLEITSMWKHPKLVTNQIIEKKSQLKKEVLNKIIKKKYQLKNTIYDIIQKGILSLKQDEKIIIVCKMKRDTFYKYEIFNYKDFVIATLYNVSRGKPIFTEEFTVDSFIKTLKDNNDIILRVEKQNRDSKSLEILFSNPNPKGLETVGRSEITPLTSQSWQGVCVICYDENDTSPLCQVNCPFKHVFHCHCIDEYINTHETNEMAYPEAWENDIYMKFKQACPICRNKITEKSVIEKVSFGKKKNKKKMVGIKKDISVLLKM